MRFIVIVKATGESESGQTPTQESMAVMQAFNESLAEAGALLGADGLRSSASGARLRFSGGTPIVIGGPFASARDLMAGFWLIRADSLHDAVELMKRAPMPAGAEIEIRQIAEAADFGEALTPEMRETDERVAVQMAANAK